MQLPIYMKLPLNGTPLSYVVFSVKNTSIIEVDYCNFIGGSGCNFLSICENNLGYF